MPPQQQQMTYPINLTLTSDRFDQRHLDIPSGGGLTIGRASQRPLGPQPDPLNALFHSGVVSRYHAQLRHHPSAPTDQQITITDMFSSHGTRIVRSLEPGQPESLRSGDLIQFGVDLTDGNETHNAIVVHFQKLGVIHAPFVAGCTRGPGGGVRAHAGNGGGAAEDHATAEDQDDDEDEDMLKMEGDAKEDGENGDETVERIRPLAPTDANVHTQQS